MFDPFHVIILRSDLLFCFLQVLGFLVPWLKFTFLFEILYTVAAKAIH